MELERLHSFNILEATASQGVLPSGLVQRAIVIELLETGQIIVGIRTDPPQLMRCDWLATIGNLGTALRIGDSVLVACPSSPHEDGVVLGLISTYRRVGPQEAAETKQHLKQQSTESLSLTCGDSSLTLRKDGKILIQGADLLLLAKRTVRVKGGSVAIN